MKKIFSNISRVMLAALGLSAATGCPMMYGSPYYILNVNGTVTDENGTPIEGLEVAAGKFYESDSDGKRYVYLNSRESVLTGKDGKFEIKESYSAAAEESCAIIVKDVDGEENGGKFAADTVEVKLVKTKDGDHGWYEGDLSNAGPVEIKLKKEEK